MYASIRDHVALCGWPTIREALNALKFNAVEMEFRPDNSVFAITPSSNAQRFRLDDPSGLEAFRGHLIQNRVQVSSLLMANNFASDDLEGEIKWTIAAIRAADKLGITTVRVDAMMHGEGEDAVEKNIRVFSDAMSRVLDATSDSEVDIGIENHGYQGNRPDFLDAVLQKVGSPRVGLTLDTGNFYWYGHPIETVYQIIEHFAPYTKHTHAKNIKYPADMSGIQREVGWEYEKYASPIPDGDVDHARVVQILKSAGYDRDLCLEDESLGKFQGTERRDVMIRDASYFHSIL